MTTSHVTDDDDNDDYLPSLGTFDLLVVGAGLLEALVANDDASPTFTVALVEQVDPSGHAILGHGQSSRCTARHGHGRPRSLRLSRVVGGGFGRQHARQRRTGRAGRPGRATVCYECQRGPRDVQRDFLSACRFDGHLRRRPRGHGVVVRTTTTTTNRPPFRKRRASGPSWPIRPSVATRGVASTNAVDGSRTTRCWCRRPIRRGIHSSRFSTTRWNASKPPAYSSRRPPRAAENLPPHADRQHVHVKPLCAKLHHVPDAAVVGSGTVANTGGWRWLRAASRRVRRQNPPSRGCYRVRPSYRSWTTTSP
jgi:hypothetical protein